MAKGGYESRGDPLSPEETFPEVVWFYEHSRPDRGREELELVLAHWRDIVEVVASAPDRRQAMQVLVERFQLGQPAVLLIFSLKIGDLTGDARDMILSIPPRPTAGSG
jgi:hypothetical protein